MKIKTLLILIFVSFSAIGQQTDKWMDNLNNPKYESYKLTNKNYKTEYLKYDFSTLLIPKSDFLGYIGNNYQRIKIFFTCVVKDTLNPDLYLINGISLVGLNKCDFSGFVKIKQIREYKTMHFGVDNIYENKGLKAQGILIGEYEFRENLSQNHSGLFKGIMTLNWYLDKFDIIHHDYIEWYSDNYKNNQYIGKWSDYNSANEKICNWGEKRIPFSGDLDIGAGGFSPNPDYYNKGWNDYEND